MPQQSNHLLQVFYLRIPAADAVAAIGQFNNWSTVETLLIKVGNDLWEMRLDNGVDPHSLRYFVWAAGFSTGRVLRFLPANTRMPPADGHKNGLEPREAMVADFRNN